eukprot:7384442-Prymnesium_polylepis.2
MPRSRGRCAGGASSTRPARSAASPAAATSAASPAAQSCSVSGRSAACRPRSGIRDGAARPPTSAACCRPTGARPRRARGRSSRPSRRACIG